MTSTEQSPRTVTLPATPCASDESVPVAPAHESQTSERQVVGGASASAAGDAGRTLSHPLAPTKAEFDEHIDCALTPIKKEAAINAF